MKRIGILIERERSWGRLLCEGVAAYAQSSDEWSLSMLERNDLRHVSRLKAFDGFIARVSTAKIARCFVEAGRLVADLSCEHQMGDAIVRGVVQDNVAVGQLAARHFLEHRFTNFAFCGYDGKRFSDARRNAYRRFLELHHAHCHLYASPRNAVMNFDESVSRHERLTAGADANKLRDWLRALPKPCAVFCANDLRSYQLLLACSACGLRVPQDIAILGVDNDSLICNFTTPTLSSIDPDAFGLGYAAAEFLDRRLSNPKLSDMRPRRISPRELVTRASSEIFPLDPPWLSDALVFIRHGLMHHLTAANVYAHVGLSHTRVNAVFKEKLGTTVQKEIRAAQMSEAKRLIRTTNMSLAEIARRAGFASPQYFCNVYSASYGHPPSAERVQIRK